MACLAELDPHQRQVRAQASQFDQEVELLYSQGRYGRATKLAKQSLTIWEALYPQGRYPAGHPDLVLSLNTLGTLLQAQGEYRGARADLEHATTMYQDLSTMFVATAAEAEALNFAAALPLTRDGLFSLPPHTDFPPDRLYGVIWRSRAAITRTLGQRHRELLRAADP